MSPSLYTLLLLGALAAWYLHYARTAKPVVSCCPHCGDFVQHAPGLPTRCPSCKRLTLI